MQELMNKTREEAITLIIEECREYIRDLRRRWEEEGKLMEETGKKIAELTQKVEKSISI